MWIQDAFGPGAVRNLENSNIATELVIAMQPIAQSTGGRQVGFYEALLRVPTSSDPVFHVHLLRLAEQLSFIGLIDLSVLSQAIATLERFQDQCIAINISPQSIAENGVAILKRLAASNVSHRLIIELTENTQVAPSLMTAFAEGVHNLGIRLAVDDFEMGFADEERVLAVKPSFIKVVFEDHTDTIHARIQRSVALARKIGADVVVEKIDSQKKIDIAKKLGASYLQGFAIGRPILLPHFMPARADLLNAQIPVKERPTPRIRSQLALAIDALNSHADVGLVEEARG